MKKRVFLALVLVVALSLSSCGFLQKKLSDFKEDEEEKPDDTYQFEIVPADEYNKQLEDDEKGDSDTSNEQTSTDPTEDDAQTDDTQNNASSSSGAGAGSLHRHVYDQQVPTEAYQAGEKGVYYYSCICGAKGTETFKSLGIATDSDKAGWGEIVTGQTVKPKN